MPKPRATLQMSPELATCPECPNQEPPSGFLRSVPRVPKAHTERPLRIPSECATCPESPHRKTPPDSIGVCHVSRNPTPKDPSGFLRSVPRVPKAHTERPLRIPSECDTCPGRFKPFSSRFK